MRAGRVTVGIHADDGAAAHENGGGLTVVEIGAIQEFGLTIEHEDGTETVIPERSFVRAWFDEQTEENRALIRAAALKVVGGELGDAQALAILGAAMQASMQARISAGLEPPNAPSTIRAKGSSKPLIASGQLRSTCSFEVGGER
ncbi:MAG: hypothetical protein L6Q76_00060 [Polyangiaceae bacterium]|nr:hypothetical protein [Polyangiaceae bacterium]